MARVPEGLRAQEAVDAEVTATPAVAKGAARVRAPHPERPPAPDEFFRAVVKRSDVREILEKLAKK